MPRVKVMCHSSAGLEKSPCLPAACDQAGECEWRGLCQNSSVTHGRLATLGDGAEHSGSRELHTWPLCNLPQHFRMFLSPSFCKLQTSQTAPL